MTHVARGVDDEGTLTVDVVMSGQVPQLPPDVQVTVLPYTEQYIQSGPGRSVCLSVCLSLSESIWSCYWRHSGVSERWWRHVSACWVLRHGRLGNNIYYTGSDGSSMSFNNRDTSHRTRSTANWGQTVQCHWTISTVCMCVCVYVCVCVCVCVLQTFHWQSAKWHFYRVGL